MNRERPQAKFLACIIAACLLAMSSSCTNSKTDSSTGVVKLSATDVAALLGIRENDSLKLGDIESDKYGVRLSSISFQDTTGKDIDIKKIDLQIGTPKDLVYEIDQLRIEEIDFHDWKSNQRTKATGINVSKPGQGFIPAIEKAIAASNSGAELTTGNLAFKKLEIGNIDYLVRAADSSVTRVGVSGFSITDATTDSLGTLEVKKVSIGDSVSVEGLKILQVNRRWADFLLGAISNVSASEPTSTTTRTFDLGDRVLPFDRFDVGQFVIRFPNPESSEKLASINLKGLNLNVDRTSTGELSGINAAASIHIPVDTFPKELKDILMSVNRTKFAQGAVGDAKIQMTFDAIKQIESFRVITLTAPELFEIKASMTTRNFATSLAQLLAKRDITKEIQQTMLSSLTIDYKDSGLMAYLVSDRHKESESVKDGLKSMRKEIADGSDKPLHTKEILQFIQSPKQISLRVTSAVLVPAEGFFAKVFAKVFRIEDSDANSSVKATLTFSPR